MKPNPLPPSRTVEVIHQAFTDEHCHALKSYLQDHPDATLEELRTACGVVCSLETVSQTLKRLGITRKKTLKASEQDREDVQEDRKVFQEDLQNMDVSRLVFLDESSAKTNMTGHTLGHTKANAPMPALPMDTGRPRQ